MVVVGGAGGIGAAIVKHYSSDEEYEIVVADINEPADSIAACGNVNYVRLDLLSSEAINSCVCRIKEIFRTVTHVICTAGGAVHGEYELIESQLDKVVCRSINLNLIGVISIVKSLIPLIKADGNVNKSILLVSSINSISCYGLPAYSAAKSGLIGFKNSMIIELGKMNIRINCILPGSVETSNKMYEPRKLDALRSRSPLGRLSSAEEIAKAAFAITELMTSMTGESVVCDCGQSMNCY